MIDVRAHGARGDGAALETAAFQSAVDAAVAAGGGTVSVPPGRYLLGGVVLGSGVHLHLQAGATLVASPDYADFETHRARSCAEESWHGLLYAADVDGVTITGPGRIEGSGAAYAPGEPDEYGYRAPAARRPRMILLEGCTNVRVADLTLRDAPMWTVHLVDCARVRVSGVDIDNSMTLPNTDGIDIDGGRDVTITGCVISGADDAVCLKTTRTVTGPPRTLRGVVVTGCTLTSHSCAVKIGTETHGDIADVLVAGIVARSNRGIGIQSRDAGVISDVRFADVVLHTTHAPTSFWGRAEPVHVSARPRVPGRPAGGVRRVVIDGVQGTCEGMIHLHAEPAGAVHDVELTGIRLAQLVSASPLQGETDLRPPVNPAAPDGAGWDNAYRVGPEGIHGVARVPLTGVLATGVTGLALDDVRIARPAPLPAGWDPRPEVIA